MIQRLVLIVFVLASFATANAQNDCRSIFTPRPTAEVFSLTEAPKKGAFLEILKKFDKDPEIASLFSGINGTHNEPTIREHTFSVYEQWTRQVSAKNKLPRVVAYTIALHDIGKPLAIAAGARDQQHHFTIPIMKQQLAKYGFRPTEILLAEKLVSNSTISSLLRGKLSLEEAAREIQQDAYDLGMNAADFFALKLDFYIADAGYYPQLRFLFEKTEGGKLILKSDLPQKLQHLLLAQESRLAI